MIKGDRVIHKARYSHPVSAVWHALTDPAALSTWLMPNDFAPTVGQRFSSTRAQTLASSKVKFSMLNHRACCVADGRSRACLPP